MTQVGRRGFLGWLASAGASCRKGGRQTLHVVPNFHPACMGWMAPYSVERNYCLYSYLDHQDHAVRDSEYRYVMSEIPHLVTMLERRLDRFAELVRLVQGSKVELVNAFVVEPTVNLSGGEALVMQGVVGLHWYQQVLRLRPRHCWMIDVCGWHEQMAQIVRGLGLDTFVYSRYNPTGSAESLHGVSEQMEAVHWMESPDGSRTLGVNPCHYFDGLRKVMSATQALPPEEIVSEVDGLVTQQQVRFPKRAPLLALAGQGDYSLSFLYKGYPRELMEIWERTRPAVALRFSTLSQWYDEFRIRREEFPLTTVRSGSRIYGWSAFWVNAPGVKQRFRRAEHLLQGAEALCTVASLRGGMRYPSQDLWNAWLLTALNMDRNSLWGAAVHAVYEHPSSWDIRDRFESIERICRRAGEEAFGAVAERDPESLVVFNPVSWRRTAPVELRLPAGRTIAEGRAQLLEDAETVLAEIEAPPFGCATVALKRGAPERPHWAGLPEAVETDFYTARVDAGTGALVSLRCKPSGREMLGGGANQVLAEVRGEQDQKQVFAHEIPRRAARVAAMTSDDPRPNIRALRGSLATIVEVVNAFPGRRLRRVIRFYQQSPRIDFLTETADLPHGTIVSAVFPLAGKVTAVRRGIPYGFAQDNRPEIVPVIRWSHYSLEDGGVALLDRGIPARETEGNTALLILHNTTNEYYWDKDCRWTSGAGKQRFEYALLAHEGEWRQARVAQMAYEYNSPLLAAAGRLPGNQEEWHLGSSPNVIVEALRAIDDEIEIRAVECLGTADDAVIWVSLPHEGAALTNMTGEQRTALAAASKTGNDAEYRFSVRPQQIVTLRLKTTRRVPAVHALRTFDPIVPESKRAATRGFDRPELKGHPPRSGPVGGLW